LEGQFGHLVVEFNIIEEGEFQSRDMAREQYMIDDDVPNNPHHEHVQATTTCGSEEIVDETVSELSLEDLEVECFAQVVCDLDLDKFLKQAKTSNEPSLEVPTEECFAQFEFDLDLDMIREQAHALLDPTPGMGTENGETAKTSFPNPFPSAAESLIIENNTVEAKEEQIETPPMPNLSNDKEVSTEAHSFVIIPLETQHEQQASPFQCLEEPFYAKTLKDLCKQAGNECLKMPIWTPSFILVRLLVLLISNV
jgi:hypothetical protein